MFYGLCIHNYQESSSCLDAFDEFVGWRVVYWSYSKYSCRALILGILHLHAKYLGLHLKSEKIRIRVTNLSGYLVLLTN